MGDLVVLRNLIRSTSIRDESVSTDCAFRSVAFECQFECIVARATSAVNIKTMALTLEFLGIRSIIACAGSSDTSEGFTRWYSKILRTVVRIDVRSNEFTSFRSVAQTIYRLAKAHLADANLRGLDCVARATRPASSAFRDRLKRTIAARQVYTSKQKKTSTKSGTVPPRIRIGLSQITTTPSRTSQPSARISSTHGVDAQPTPSTRGAIRNSIEFLGAPSDKGGESAERCPAAHPGKQVFDRKPRRSILPHRGGIPGRLNPAKGHSPR